MGSSVPGASGVVRNRGVSQYVNRGVLEYLVEEVSQMREGQGVWADSQDFIR